MRKLILMSVIFLGGCGMPYTHVKDCAVLACWKSTDRNLRIKEYIPKTKPPQPVRVPYSPTPSPKEGEELAANFTSH